MAMSSQRPHFLRRRSTYLGLATLTIGVLICVVLVRELGADALRAQLVQLAPTLPWLLALECARFAAELMSTRLVLAPLRSRERIDVPVLALLRGQCLAHACNKVMPAGRAVGEGLKAAVLAPSVGVGRAIGVGAASQIMTLLVNGAFALVAGVLAVALLDSPREASVMGTYGGLTVSLGVLVVFSLRSRVISGLLARFRATDALRNTFAQAATHGAGFGPTALAFHALAKVAQTLQLGLLLAAVGVGMRPDLALFAEGVQIVGAAAGDLVPAQLGATEGAFTLSAGALGLTAQSALSVAALLHASQLLFAGAIMLVGLSLKLVPSRGDASVRVGAGPSNDPRAHRALAPASARMQPEPAERG